MAEFDARRYDFSALGRPLVFVSTDAPAVTNKLRSDMKLELTLLCDPTHQAVESWGLFSREHGGIAKPAVFVLAPDRTIEVRSLGDFLRRAGADATLQALGKGGELKTQAIVPRPGDFVRAMMNP